MLPVAPARLSTMTLWPSVLIMSCASWRAMMSLAVPGPNGTTMVIDLVGKSCAPAGAGIAAGARPAIAAAMAARRDHFIACMDAPHFLSLACPGGLRFSGRGASRLLGLARSMRRLVDGIRDFSVAIQR